MKVAGRFEIPDSLAKMTAKDKTPDQVIAEGYFEPYKIWDDLLKDSFAAVLGKVGYRSSRDDINRVRSRLKTFIETVNLDYVAGANESREKAMQNLNKIWPILRQKLRYNPGMTRLMLDYGCQSWFTMPIITTGAQAILLELFDGRTRGLDGNFSYIPYGDAAALIMVCEPIGIEVRARRDYAQHVLAEETNLKVVMYGAGVCSEMRRKNAEWEANGIKWTDLGHTTVAIDRDVRNLENLKVVFDGEYENLKVLERDYGFTYTVGDILEFCNDPANTEQMHLGLAMGLLSYSRWKTKELLSVLMRPIRRGGRLVCDFQTMDPGIINDATCKGWKSNLFPDWTAWTAVQRMSGICNELGFGMEYEVVRHPFAKVSPGVLFTIYK